MRKIEALLLGEHLKKQSDKANYPSSVKKALCLSNHCAEECIRRKSIIKYLCDLEISDALFPLTYKERILLYSKKCSFVQINNIEEKEDDIKLLRHIFKECNFNMKEKEVFFIIKNLSNYLLISESMIKFIIKLVQLPSSTKESVIMLVYHFFITLGYKDTNLLDSIINKEYFFDLLDIIYIYNLHSNDLIIFMKENELYHFNKLKEFAYNNQSKLKKEVYSDGMDYFDYLVLQNELIESFDKKKKEYLILIDELKAKNKELIIKNDSLKEYVNGLEKNFNEFKGGYVNELKKIIYDLQNQNK